MTKTTNSAFLVEQQLSDKFEHLEALIHGQGVIMEMISGGESLKDVLNAIVIWAQQESSDGLIASILLMDAQGKHLLHGAAPSLPHEYNKAINGVAIGPAVGSCGTAAYLKKPIIVEDIEHDTLWENFKHLALAFGLKACWSTPLMEKNGCVLGTFAMYYKHPKKPTPSDLQIIRLITSTAVLAIKWQIAHEERQQLLASEKAVHEKIKEEKDSMYNLLMNAPAMVAVLKGPQHIFELANPLYLDAVGPNRDILNKPVKQALPEVEGQGFIELLDNVYKSGESFYGNELLVQLNRNEETKLENSYFNFIYQPIKKIDDSIEGIFVHAVNVTELVRARKRAEESEERFRSFVINSPMPIGIYIGREMRIQTANDAILKAWEKDRSVIGKTFREALPELEGQPFYELLDEVFTTGNTYQALEDRVDLLRDGKITATYWNFTYKALRNEEGEIFGVINTGTEITDLVKTKQKLSEAEETLRSAIEIAELGTWSVDLKNNIVTYSAPLVNWLGLPVRGAALEEMLQRIDETSRRKLYAAAQHALEGSGVFETEFKVINPINNSSTILQAKGKVVCDENGARSFLTGICRDISLQKETEKQLARQVEHRTIELQKANAELNALNENLKQFVYVASHDLQEPLRKINMFSDILLKKNESQQVVSEEKYLQKIVQASRRMSNLIKDLLNYSRLEANHPDFSETDLNEVVRNVIEDYELLVQQKDARFFVNQLDRITALPLQMNQLFYNLIGNALKFSKPDISPVIEIGSKILSADEVLQNSKLNKDYQYVEIVVSDNGIGFDQNYEEQIFVIFQRLHTRDKFEGTGIGLALCKKIVENHKGLMYASSKPNEGASFHIILPVKSISGT